MPVSGSEQRSGRRNGVPEEAKHTITFDNGGEFAEHEKLERQTEFLAFLCDPHSPWQRGAIENTNGIIRPGTPRKTDIADYSTTDVDDIMWAVNSTPRKCHCFKTPAEAFIENSKLHLRCETNSP